MGKLLLTCDYLSTAAVSTHTQHAIRSSSLVGLVSSTKFALLHTDGHRESNFGLRSKPKLRSSTLQIEPVDPVM